MKSKACTRGYIPVFLVILALASCDSFRENDGIRPTVKSSHHYTIANGSVLIDLTPLTRQMSAAFELTIPRMPARGRVSPVSDLLYRYDPDTNFKDGTDEINFVIKDTDGILTSHIVTIHVLDNTASFPCGMQASQDKIKVTVGFSVTIQPLENDGLCNALRKSMGVSLYTEPEHGQATVNGQSVVYMPGVDFPGYDEFIYALTRPGTDSIAYGIVSVANYATVTTLTLKHPNYISDREYYFDLDLSFVEDGIGFMTASHLFPTDRIWRTMDAGLHWDAVWQNPWGEPLTCTDLFFLDADHGYAAFGGSGLAYTANGGKTWQKTRFDRAVAAVAFTSPDTGFVATHPDYEDYVTHITLLKTYDGGITWKEVIPTGIPSNYGLVEIHFVDSNTGYLRLSDQVLATTDGGEHWFSILSDKGLAVFTVTRENGPLAVFRKNQWGISKWTIESGWSDFSRLDGTIYGLQFSPSGNVGFAVTGKGDLLSVARTIDGGLTWTNVPTRQPVQLPKMDIYITSYLKVYAASDDMLHIRTNDRVLRYAME